MRDLRLRMDAGVRAAGALHQHFFARQGFNSRGQHALHGQLVSLDLPAGEGPAVIFNDELVARHFS